MVLKALFSGSRIPFVVVDADYAFRAFDHFAAKIRWECGVLVARFQHATPFIVNRFGVQLQFDLLRVCGRILEADRDSFLLRINCLDLHT